MRQSQGVALASDDMHNARNSTQLFYSCYSIPKFTGAKSKMLKSCLKEKKKKEQTYRLVVLNTNSSRSPSLLSVSTSFRENTARPSSQIWPHDIVFWLKPGGRAKKAQEKKGEAEAQLGSRQRERGWRIWGFPQWKQHLMRGGFWRAPLDGIHAQDCRNSQGHIHFFFFSQDLNKERKTWFLPANYCNKGFSVEAKRCWRQCNYAPTCTGYNSHCTTATTMALM